MKFDDLLSFNLINATNVLWVSFDKMLKKNGISSGQIFVLCELWNQDGLNQTQIAERLNITTPTVNSMIKSLEANDFITVKRNETDRRVTDIFLADKAQLLQTDIYQAWKEFDKRIFLGFSETEKLILLQLSVKLLNGLIK